MAMLSIDKQERLERTLWELEQLAVELQDLGYLDAANMIHEAVDFMDAAVEGFDGDNYAA